MASPNEPLATTGITAAGTAATNPVEAAVERTRSEAATDTLRALNAAGCALADDLPARRVLVDVVGTTPPATLVLPRGVAFSGCCLATCLMLWPVTLLPGLALGFLPAAERPAATILGLSTAPAVLVEPVRAVLATLPAFPGAATAILPARCPSAALIPAVDALTIRAVAALAAAFLDADEVSAPFEGSALKAFLDPFVFKADLGLAAAVLTLVLLELFCANAPSACAKLPSNTTLSNSLDIQFTAPISAKTSQSRDGF